MKVLAFAATSSKNSINKQLANYAAKQIEGALVELIDLNDYEMPLFSEDREKELGHPELAKAFYQKLGEADVIVISFAEHNGSYSAAYKNLFDWTSRINTKVFQNKPVIMLATSPGPGGAATVLAAAKGSAPYFGADLKGAISVPSFYDNFDVENGRLTNKELVDNILSSIAQL
ncbi:NADPH-dependent FMN reductase [Psychromonas antarctica]|uniref:NADPH-dependent FMN reductase n=1 Tax=Psychromonas antarctica TaxID=67573 RepID=UPI001EE7C117|nr:NAD(P)H-dependent oxidoreductase [Psychromonas antarctica]MCG6201047.1 NAD(P)H-dependent oxidoreductase [Psychromonas antarctica]